MTSTEKSTSARVLDQVRGSTSIEGALHSLPKSQRVAVFASYSSSSTVSRTVTTLISELRLSNYVVLFVRASESTDTLDWPDGIPDGVIVVRKPNIGYDFGSWATALELYPEVRKLPYVLLVNDSIVGPFAPLQEVIQDFESAYCDVWASSTNPQFFTHGQSFFMGYRDGALDSPQMREYWSRLNVHETKAEIIDRYELGLNRFLFNEGFVLSAFNPWEKFGPRHVNPMIDNWREVMEFGFPFVKRELLNFPDLVEDSSDIVPFIFDTYGEDALAWL